MIERTDNPASRTGNAKLQPTSLGAYALLVLVALAFATPIVWMVLVAVRPAAWANLKAVWHDGSADFPRFTHNSALVAVLAVPGMTLSSAVVAFGFSRLRWRGRDALFAVVLLTLMIPPAVVMAPQYLVFKKLGWVGTLLPLWVPAWCAGAFGVFLLRQFYRTIPRELDEAARMDGCSDVGVLVRMILPLSKPALIIVALMQFVGSWNDFLGPLLFLNDQETYTLPLGLHMYQSQQGATPWNLLMMASLLTAAPVLALYLVTRRYFVEGVATWGGKE